MGFYGFTAMVMLSRFSYYARRVAMMPARGFHSVALTVNKGTAAPNGIQDGASCVELVSTAPEIVRARDIQQRYKSFCSVIRIIFGCLKPVQNRALGVLEGMLTEALWNIKRTFQPSLIRRKRKHGFLSRARTRHGRAILARRRQSGKTRLCARECESDSQGLGISLF